MLWECIHDRATDGLKQVAGGTRFNSPATRPDSSVEKDACRATFLGFEPSRPPNGSRPLSRYTPPRTPPRCCSSPSQSHSAVSRPAHRGHLAQPVRARPALPRAVGRHGVRACPKLSRSSSTAARPTLPGPRASGEPTPMTPRPGRSRVYPVRLRRRRLGRDHRG